MACLGRAALFETTRPLVATEHCVGFVSISNIGSGVEEAFSLRKTLDVREMGGAGLDWTGLHLSQPGERVYSKAEG